MRKIAWAIIASFIALVIWGSCLAVGWKVTLVSIGSFALMIAACCSAAYLIDDYK
jgi:hypothetical protein